jgi:DNA methylase
MSLTENFEIAPGRKTSRRVRNGKPSNDLIFSAHHGTNDDLFPSILSLYVAPGSAIADITFGKGVFWKKIDRKAYRLKTTDLATGTDSRKLPYRDKSIDCVVFDPPYMHTPGGSAHVGHQNFEQYYGNNNARSVSKYHEAVLELYFETAVEVKRVLRNNGTFIVKCQDEVCANQQRLTHVEIINYYQTLGFCVEDLFVLMRRNKPGMSRVARQVHARKNHSYFMVFWKCADGKKRWKGPQIPSIS